MIRMMMMMKIMMFSSSAPQKCNKSIMRPISTASRSGSRAIPALTIMSLIVTQLSLLSGVVHSAAAPPPLSAPTSQQIASTCKRELLSANRTLAAWAQNFETMVTESKLPSANRENIHKTANQVLDAIEDFGQRVESRPPAQLAKDLVSIRRQSNRMALEIYLHTLDMRWPQTSLQLGFTIERVQQACLDRNSILALETAPNPVDMLAFNN